jgi:hypothetical protein
VKCRKDLLVKSFREKQGVPSENTDLWWLAFRRPGARFVAARIPVLVRAAALGYRSIGKPALELAPTVDS